MQRALDLAILGQGSVSPNPLVGCVVVHENKIIGEGYHKIFGGPHAEVNAIASVSDKSLLNKSSLYVSLEPCNHYGKTPPCTEFILQMGIPRVVVSNQDPNPIVAGKGIEKLRNAGVELILNIKEKEGKWLNRRFFTSHSHQRPYIILKWAQTSDGFIAKEDYDSKWISNELSRQLVHKWRSEEDAILVGFNTALHDNPQLNVRDWSGRNPIRIVIDHQLDLPKDHFLYDSRQKTIIFNKILNDIKGNIEYIQSPDISVGFILKSLFKRNIQSIIIEGGSKLITQFMEAGLWDEARVFTAKKVFHKGISAPIMMKKPSYTENLFDDVLDWHFNS